MRCGFCFATFQDVKQEMNLPRGHLPQEACLSVVERIATAGFEKINFAGGEPTLCPWLPNLISRAKQLEMTTSIVTNGSRITGKWLDSLDGILDWIALSIDTVDSEKLIRTGRAVCGNNPITREEYLRLIHDIKRYGIRLKINTVVTSETWEEDFTGFMRLAKPERWKIFQVLRIKGQNDVHIADFEVTAAQFDAYVQRNRSVEDAGITVVPESNELMTESYVMIDPSGRLYDNAQGHYRYSDPILKVGVEDALNQVTIDRQRFDDRLGEYAW